MTQKIYIRLAKKSTKNSSTPKTRPVVNFHPHQNFPKPKMRPVVDFQSHKKNLTPKPPHLKARPVVFFELTKKLQNKNPSKFLI